MSLVPFREMPSQVANRQELAQWYEKLFKACGSRALTPIDYLVGVSIGRHVNFKSGKCFPGLACLAKENGRSVKTVERSITVLEAGGFLRTSRSRFLEFLLILKESQAVRTATQTPEPANAANYVTHAQAWLGRANESAHVLQRLTCSPSCPRL